MKGFVSTVVCIAMTAALASAEVSAQLRSDLEKSQGALVQQRTSQLEQSKELGDRVHSLEKELLVLRQQSLLARLSRQEKNERKARLEQKSQKFSDEAAYLSTMYGELAAHMLDERIEGQVRQGSGELDSLLEQAARMDLALERLESLVRGEPAAAKVVGADGVLLSGKDCKVGPQRWFLSDDKKVGGVVIEGVAGAAGRLQEGELEQVKALFAGNVAELEVDVTGGKARDIAVAQSGSLDLIKKGGIWLWPILLIALISTVCAVVKFIELVRIREPQGEWVAGILAALKSGDNERASQSALSVAHPAGAVIHTAMQYVSAGADVAEEVLYEQLIGVQSKLQKWLSFIAVTAAAAPLLGLLGTVSGMIRMFSVLQVTGAGDVKPMAGGISEALVTTLFGLIVAIPALVLHSVLSRRSNGIAQNTEKYGLTFVNGLRVK